jgi:hypothetical protein
MPAAAVSGNGHSIGRPKQPDKKSVLSAGVKLTSPSALQWLLLWPILLKAAAAAMQCPNQPGVLPETHTNGLGWNVSLSPKVLVMLIWLPTPLLT